MSQRDIYVLQIATPFSTGTGFYLADHDLVVTNEHVVRDNPSVLVSCEGLDRCLMPVVYLDPYYDLAFLRPNHALELPHITPEPELPAIGDKVVAMGHNYGQRFQEREGEVLATDHEHHGLHFIQHTARLESAQSGGPLFNEAGQLLGINMYDIDEGHQRALTLPAAALLKCLEEFRMGDGRTATRCFDCQTLNFEPESGAQHHCRNCGSTIVLPRDVPDHHPTGVQATVEQIIEASGHDPRMARRGPNLWEIVKGSAHIQVAYHEDSGLVTGDARLCQIPDDHPPALFEYLLRQNFALEQLTFSTRGRDIILSLLIYDRYLSQGGGLEQFEHLFDRADYYDNYLVEHFGAGWA